MDAFKEDPAYVLKVAQLRLDFAALAERAKALAADDYKQFCECVADVFPKKKP